MTHANEYFAKRALRFDELLKQYPYVTEWDDGYFSSGESLIGHKSLKSAQTVLIAEEKRVNRTRTEASLADQAYPYTERCRVEPESRLYVHTSLFGYYNLKLYKSSDFLNSPHYESGVADARAYLKKWCPLEK
jgi:hypothetical protein